LWVGFVFQEYWKELEEIRDQYHNDVKAIRKKMGREHEVNLPLQKETFY
jgi:NIMA (never in mitosis gene a)-related kinase